MTDNQIDKLHKLNTLRKDGVISEAEFEKQKSRILAPRGPVFISSDGKRIVNTTSSSSSRSRNWVFILCGTFIIGFLILVGQDKNKAPAETEEEVKVMTSRDTLNNLYAIATLVLKQSMKNPDSYVVVSHHEYLFDREKKDRKKKSYLRFRVYIKYRATNAFNAIVTEEKIFNYNQDMNLINIEDR